MLILASSSPRRQRLLTFLGMDFQVHTAEIDESTIPGERPDEYVLRLALSKSQSIKLPTTTHQVIITADTAVVYQNQILGKPIDKQQALDMLRQLRSRSHYVITGLAVRDTETGKVTTDSCITEVCMRSYHDDEIKDYVASGDPLDKAGAYAIQNSGFNPVSKISGCYTNVVGLPLCHLTDILQNTGVKFHKEVTRGCRTSQGYSCQLADRIQGFSSP